MVREIGWVLVARRIADIQVKADIASICQEHGPFDGMFILFANGSYGPMDEDLLGPLWKNGNSESWYLLPILTRDIGVFAQCGTGYDNVRVDHLTKHDCYFTNTPEAVVASTADFTVFLFLAALRGSTYCEQFAKTGLWHKGLELTTDPAGLTLGMSFATNVRVC